MTQTADPSRADPERPVPDGTPAPDDPRGRRPWRAPQLRAYPFSVPAPAADEPPHPDD